MKTSIILLFVISIIVFASGAVLGQGSAAPYTLRLETILTGLDRPILYRASPDASKRMFIVEQTGKIKVLQPGASTAAVFIDLSTKITVPTSTGDERGLLGLTFHPQFSTNGKFYVDYTRASDAATVIAEYTLNSANPNQGDINTERVLLTIPQPFANHNGGMKSRNKNELIEVEYFSQAFGDGEMPEVEGIK